MDRTEVVTITNMCMIYDGNTVLVQEKTDDDYCGVTFPGGHVEKANLADGMEKMLEVFLKENLSEYFFYKENNKWVDVLK